MISSALIVHSGFYRFWSGSNGRLVWLAFFASISAAHAELNEKRVQECVCKGERIEVQLGSGARADCISATHAIEVDPTRKWAEALGQALHYASETSLKPKIVLYCEPEETSCLSHVLRLRSTIAAYGLKVDVEEHNEASLTALCERP